MFAKIRSWFAKSETKCAESSSIDSNEIVNTMVAEHVSAELVKTAIDFVTTNRVKCSYP